MRRVPWGIVLATLVGGVLGAVFTYAVVTNFVKL
jgi:hypothetical protein